MPESVEAWWARRQWSKSQAVPYAVGRYRSDWEQYPVLIRQYHPDLNHGIVLSQVPPAADVFLVWQCDAGHRFVATPGEQRNRPGTSRRRSTWCPDCSQLARPARVSSGDGHRRRVATGRPSATARAPIEPDRQPGDAFISARAPKTASAAEGDLRARLRRVLDLELAFNAVQIAHPFFGRFEVWPDIVIPELRVAIEYDTTGRDGLEHVGRREPVDRRKDRLLRAVGWEVIRIRCGKLHPLGPYDLTAPGVSGALVERILDQLRAIRGDLIVAAYLVRRAG